MLYWAIISLLLFSFVFEEIIFFRRALKGNLKHKEELNSRINVLSNTLDPLKKNIGNLEGRLMQHFSFYDLMRKIAPFVNKKELFKAFCEEVKYLGEVESIGHAVPEDGDFIKLELGSKDDDLYIKTKSKTIIEYKETLSKILELYLERINLYDKFQQLSIYDNLTESYNRRYFLIRFVEEFERTKKFSLNMSFLMIDVDDFKKINDTYGHLVGDAVLKEVAKIIKENIREIDSLSRFGGEEFALILPETDKTSAIVVGERIRSRIYQEIIKAFDEALNITISIGVASFPQNTLYPDVLMEIADKALYQAKMSGKNKVSWF